MNQVGNSTLLQQRLQHLESIVAGSPIGIVETDLEGRYLGVNDAFCRLTGYTRDELLGRSVVDITHPEDWPRNLAAYRELVSGERDALRMEKRYVRKDGGIAWADVQRSLLRDDAGRPAAVVGAVIDIGERKRSEGALRESEQLFRAAFSDSSVAMAQADAHSGRFLAVNEAYCRLVGRSEAELLGLRFADITHADDRDADAALLQRWIRGEVPEFVREKRYLRPDGACVWALLTLNLLPAADGGAPRLMAVAQDVTERRTTAAALAAERRRLDLALNAAQMYSWEIDVASGRANWSENAASLLGFPAMPATVAEAMTYSHPDDVATVERTLRGVLDGTSDGFSFEQRLIHPQDGSLRWVAVTGMRLRGAPDGPPSPPTRVFGVTQHISARKTIEAELQHALQRADLAQEAARAFLYEFRPHSGQVLRGQSLTPVLGWAVNELPATGEGWRDLIHPDDRDAMWAAIGEGITSGQGYALEYRVRHREGHHVWLHDRAHVLRDGGVMRVVGMIIDVDERRQLEIAREREHRLLDAVLEHLPVGVMLTDAKGEQGRTNAALNAMWRGAVPLDTAATWSRYEAWEADTREPLAVADWPLARALITGKLQPVREIGFRRFDGSEGRMAVHALPLRDEDGRVVRGIAVAQEVTEQHEARLLLEGNARTFQTLVEHCPYGLYVVDDELNLRYLSDGARLAFANVPDVVGTHLYEALSVLWPRDAAREFTERFQHTLATGEPYISAHTVEQRADLQRTEAYDWRLHRIVLPDGRHGVVCYYYDLSERERQEQQLRDSEARRTLAMQAARMGAWETDLVSGQNQWDPRIAEILGLNEHDAAARSDDWLGAIHADDRERVASEFAAAVADQGEYDTEFRLVTPNGLRWVASAGRKIRDADGRIVRMVGVVQDITERKRIEEALKLADRRKDIFLATLSHELRNPLAPISTAADVLGNVKLGDGQLHRLRQIIQRQARHMALLLDDLLDMARVTQGKLQLKIERTSLAGIVDVAIESARPLIDGRQHRLTVALPEADVLLRADPLRAAQVFANLLTNAAKYTAPGGRIELIAAVEGEMVAVEVRDDGIGLPADALASIFEMFSQVRDHVGRAEGGLGIGLALVKGLTELHGGSVTAASDGPSHGSTFTVRLPLAALAAADALSADGTSADDQIAPCRVLVADDNEDAAESLAMLLRLAGHEVRVAHGGEAAVSIAQAFRPDVALLDIGMPQMDGMAVARALRREGWADALYLVALTGWGQEDDRQRSGAAGFDLHLTKPVEASELQMLIAKCRVQGRAGATKGF